MSQDPQRLLDGGATSPHVRSVLAAGRAELPDGARLASIAARLGPVLSTAPAAAAATGLSATTKIIVTVVAGAVAIGGGVGVVHLRHARQAASLVSYQPAPPASAPASALASAPPEAASPEALAPPQSSASLGPVRPAPEDPRAEAALLQQAKDLVRATPRRALAICDQHARRFPHGALAQEREVIAIEALVALGERESAERRTARFIARYPGSSHLRRIEQILQQ